MKMLTSFFVFALSFGTFASTVDTKTFVYDGTQNSTQLTLRTEKTHTEYRTEQRRSTCYRTEVVGYRTECYGGGYGGGYPYPRPYPGPGRGYPYPYPSRYCSQVPVYGSVPYSCMQTVKIPFEVKDYDVEANVIVDVTNLSSEVTTGETFKVTLNGETLSYEVNGSKKFFIVKKKEDVRSSRSGSVKMLDAVLATELVPAAPLMNTIKISDIRVNGKVLNFTLSGVESTANIGYSLKVIKKKRLSSDPVLFNRNLSAEEVTVNGLVAGVNLDNLGVKINDGKFELTARAFVQFDGAIMNSSQFGESLESSRTLIYGKN